MSLVKKLRGLTLAFLAGGLMISSAHAVADLRVVQDPATGIVSLNIFDQVGNLVKSIALGSIREKVSAGGQDAVYSFGQNPAGNLVLIVAPDPDNPREIVLRINGRRVVLSREAVVTITFPRDPSSGRLGDPLIRPGLVGTVALDGRRLAPDMAVELGTGQPVPIAQGQAPSPLPPAGEGSDEFEPRFSVDQLAGGSGFFDLDSQWSVGGVSRGSGGSLTLNRVASSLSDFLGSFFAEVGVNLNPSAATPLVPEQT